MFSNLVFFNMNLTFLHFGVLFFFLHFYFFVISSPRNMNNQVQILLNKIVFIN